MSTSRRLLALGIAALLVGAWAISGSIFSPTSFIRASILRETPLGTSFSEVEATVKQKGWLAPNYGGSTGFLKQESGEPNEVIGVTSMRGSLGDWGPMNISAYWGFDRDGRLIDVWVWRTFEAP
jgi:hypothetical protein